MIPRFTENTITSILAVELQGLGLDAAPFSMVDTPEGRREVDILCHHNGLYPLEAKFTERDLIKAITKIQNDYLKHHDILGIKGGFALLYPEIFTRPISLSRIKESIASDRFKAVMMFLPDDPRGFSVFEGSLFEVAAEISRQILEQPEYVEPSIDYIIKALRETALTIATGLQHLRGAHLGDLFGGKEVFENILQYEERDYPEESLRLASGYILINQLLFYQVLSGRMPNKFPRIDINEISSPSDLKIYFRLVQDVNYQVIYQYDVASRIPIGSIDGVRSAISVVQALAPQKVGGDLLGTIFHDLVPFETRKSVAAFYTNVLAAELLSWLSIDRWDAAVADLACGSGGLLVAAYRRKRYLRELRGKFTQRTHRMFVERDLLGIDVMPFAANVAACHMALQSPEYFTDKIRVAVWDSTELDPETKGSIPSVASTRYVSKGQLTMESYDENDSTRGTVSLTGYKAEEIVLERNDVIIMNPPFTRQERMPVEYKKLLNERFEDYEEYLHGQLGYHGYFILLADRFLKDGGKMALVLPATILRVKSCEGIRKLFSERYHVEHIIVTTRRSAFSESVHFREMLLVASKKTPVEGMKTKITTLNTLPTTMLKARDLARTIADEEDYEDEVLTVIAIPYQEFTENTGNWFRHIQRDPFTQELMERMANSDKMTTINQLGLAIKRGAETARGGKIQTLTITKRARAIKKSDEWVITEVKNMDVIAENRFSHMRLEIPLKSLSPALRRVSQVLKMDITGDTDFVIKRDFPRIDEYFRRSITDYRPPQDLWDTWEKYVEERRSKLAVVRRADISAPGTNLLAFYSEKPFAPSGLAWSIATDDQAAKILVTWFNSSLNLLQLIRKRKETRGAFIQMDKYVLEDFIIPDPAKLTEEDVDELLEIFNKVRYTNWPSILEQLENRHEDRELIDKAWFKVIGCKRSKKLIRKLHDTLAEEIRLLKELMEEEG